MLSYSSLHIKETSAQHPQVTMFRSFVIRDPGGVKIQVRELESNANDTLQESSLPSPSPLSQDRYLGLRF